MIFSHLPMPLGMRIFRIGKRISVHGVSLDTALYRPYCCATVDTTFVSLTGNLSRRRTSARPARLLGYSRPPLPFGGVSGRNHEETHAGSIISLCNPTSSTFSASRPTASCNVVEKEEKEPTSGLEPLTLIPLRIGVSSERASHLG
jgi:hypothetical protein